MFPKLQSSLTGLISRAFWPGAGTAPCAFIAEALPLSAHLPASVGLSLEEVGSLGARADSYRADREMGSPDLSVLDSACLAVGWEQEVESWGGTFKIHWGLWRQVSS